MTNPEVLGDPTAGRKRKKKSKKCKLNSKAKGCRKSSRVAGRDVIGKKATVVNVRVGDSGGGSRKASAPPIAAPTFVTFAPPPQPPPAPVMEAPRPQPQVVNHYHSHPAAEPVKTHVNRPAISQVGVKHALTTTAPPSGLAKRDAVRSFIGNTKGAGQSATLRVASPYGQQPPSIGTPHASPHRRSSAGSTPGLSLAELGPSPERGAQRNGLSSTMRQRVNQARAEADEEEQRRKPRTPQKQRGDTAAYPPRHGKKLQAEAKGVTEKGEKTVTVTYSQLKAATDLGRSSSRGRSRSRDSTQKPRASGIGTPPVMKRTRSPPREGRSHTGDKMRPPVHPQPEGYVGSYVPDAIRRRPAPANQTPAPSSFGDSVMGLVKGGAANLMRRGGRVKPT